jgi:2-polyprenyl-3-methyl-5-hydroxy-6-metoxy-1,4-benzoquinol methylase
MTLKERCAKSTETERIRAMDRARSASIDDTMRASFQRVKQAERYRQWILDQSRAHLGRRVLEVGAGIGNITEALISDRERVVALDPSLDYLAELERRLGGETERLRTMAAPLEDPSLSAELESEHLDSALLLNVLEHIDDDVAALSNLTSALEPGSAVVIQVPAHTWLYGTADRALGHCRRYGPSELRRVIDRSGLRLERMWQFNTLGVVGWFVSGRLRRKPMFSRFQLAVYEALVPLQRLLEPERGVPLGLSLMAWARTAHHSGRSLRREEKKTKPARDAIA